MPQRPRPSTALRLEVAASRNVLPAALCYTNKDWTEGQGVVVYEMLLRSTERPEPAMVARPQLLAAFLAGGRSSSSTAALATQEFRPSARSRFIGIWRGKGAGLCGPTKAGSAVR
jgi:hypothetical protein